ncbi:MAG: hypothetical protein IPO22_14540 [Anaerolineales bacterium]|nr:hypothetical protein [Anaerolineales bacterium]
MIIFLLPIILAFQGQMKPLFALVGVGGVDRRSWLIALPENRQADIIEDTIEIVPDTTAADDSAFVQGSNTDITPA